MVLRLSARAPSGRRYRLECLLLDTRAVRACRRTYVKTAAGFCTIFVLLVCVRFSAAEAWPREQDEKQHRDSTTTTPCVSHPSLSSCSSCVTPAELLRKGRGKRMSGRDFGTSSSLERDIRESATMERFHPFPRHCFVYRMVTLLYALSPLSCGIWIEALCFWPGHRCRLDCSLHLQYNKARRHTHTQSSERKRCRTEKRHSIPIQNRSGARDHHTVV